MFDIVKQSKSVFGLHFSLDAQLILYYMTIQFFFRGKKDDVLLFNHPLHSIPFQERQKICKVAYISAD